MASSKPKLLVLSHVLPFPPSKGQCQRVRYTLDALKARFHLTFATTAAARDLTAVKRRLLEQCDEAVVWKSRYDTGFPGRLRMRLASEAYALAAGLKASNYMIGRVEFAPNVLAGQRLDRGYDAVLLEYWHAAASMAVFRAAGIPCVVDLHNVLWQARGKELTDMGIPKPLAGIWARRYRAREERAWRQFDALITINAGEHEYIRRAAGPLIRLFYAPMGIPMENWPYSWHPQSPPRLMYYGGLGSGHNRRDALRCLREVMPLVWRERAETEFWIVGSHPPAEFKQLESDPRVKVTGFVERPQEVLASATAVLCPWSGTYGFRSRLVEVMALGTPVIASLDAAYGMGLRDRQGFFTCAGDEQMATCALALMANPDFRTEQSRLARCQVEDVYSFENSYGRLAGELYTWLEERRSLAGQPIEPHGSEHFHHRAVPQRG